jgi:hypothetical protein
MRHGAMEQAVLEELGGKPAPSRYYLAGLADDVPDAIQTMPPPVNYTPPAQAVNLPFSPVLWNNPEPGNTPAFEASPIALTIATSNADDWLKSVSTPAPNPYTYHTPAGQFLGPPAPPDWTPTPPPSQPPAWANTLVKSLDTTVRAGAPATTAYFNYELAAQRAALNQPIYIPMSAAQNSRTKSSSDYTLLIVGGVVVIGIIAALVVLATK